MCIFSFKITFLAKLFFGTPLPETRAPVTLISKKRSVASYDTCGDIAVAAVAEYGGGSNDQKSRGGGRFPLHVVKSQFFLLNIRSLMRARYILL